MKDEYYVRMIESVKKSKVKLRMIPVFDKLITYVIFMSYPLMLSYLFFTHSPFLLQSVIVPALGFVLVSLFRKSYDAKRPYEVMGFTPIIKKETSGKSFPSRHVFSIFIIGMTYFQLDSNTGIMIFVMGLILATLRVFGGVHYIRDVVAGAITGIVFGAIGFYIIHWETIFGGL